MQQKAESGFIVFAICSLLVMTIFAIGRITDGLVWTGFRPDGNQPRRSGAGSTDPLAPAELQSDYLVGVALVDITPDSLIRGNDVSERSGTSEDLTELFAAKAMAISSESDESPVVLMTVDSPGIPASVCDELATRLAAKTGLSRSRIAISATGVQSAPILRGANKGPAHEVILDAEMDAIDRYTKELTDKLEMVAMYAIADRRPATLSWGIGEAAFATTPSTQDPPMDRDFPLLAVKDFDGSIRAVYVSFAGCGAASSVELLRGPLTRDFQQRIQSQYPSAIAMVSLGCGISPKVSAQVPGEATRITASQGNVIAAEVERLMGGFLVPVRGEITTSWDSETPEYPIATWSFGRSLAMIFLPGDVAVDDSLRLKRELDGRRLWINAHSNGLSGLTASKPKGPDGDRNTVGSAVDIAPTRPLEHGLEQRLVDTIHQSLDANFASPFDATKTKGSLPKSPHQSLATMQTTPDLHVDLVVAEPLVSDPVAIDFGLDGSLWVAEMPDYPYPGVQPASKSLASGTNPGAQSAGQIRIVRDRDGDGQFDSSTIFLKNIPFPTGITVWRQGVLVCAAPNILYAADTDGDDRADEVKVLYSGFGASNIQARVNSLSYGLDGWIYGSCGLSGGTITNFKGENIELGDRDFRIRPETGEIQPATGRTQQGRCRDEFGNWFGCDNLNLAFHYPLADHELRRNPYLAPPAGRVNIVQSPDARRLFPAHAETLRFQLSGDLGTVTAACGLGVYRDSRLGAEYTGNLFVCEPVDMLVHRLIPRPNGTSFLAERAPNEVQTEFLRSSDSWFRPVQAVTGPDGNLWVVDMYRYIIENPRWIPENELTGLDVRAGATYGRIYRVRHRTDKRPPVSQTRLASNVGDAADHDVSPSPILRELQIQGLAAQDKLKIDPRRRAASLSSADGSSLDPVARMGYYRRLDALSAMSPEIVVRVMTDRTPGIRCYGLLLAEKNLHSKEVTAQLIHSIDDSDPQVRLRAAATMGYWDHEVVGPILGRMAAKSASDPYFLSAIFSSVTPKSLPSFTKAMLEELADGEPSSNLMTPFLATAVGYGDSAAIKLALKHVMAKGDEEPRAWQFNAIANLMIALSQQGKLVPESTVTDGIRRMQERARLTVQSPTGDESAQIEAMKLLGHEPSQVEADAGRLAGLLTSVNSPTIQLNAVDALERINSDIVPALLAQHFRELSPAVQIRAIDTFLNRDPWISLLFNGIDSGMIPASALTAAQRQEVIGNPDPGVRRRATQLLAQSFNQDRQQVVHQYASGIDLPGDRQHGQALFTKLCATCHRVGEVGQVVGPNLSIVANKTPGFLLQEILDPNRNVDGRFASYIAVTKDGLTRTGLLFSESTTSVTLLATEGKQFTLQRSELEELRATGKSLMPEGLEKDLPPHAMADLISFLRAAPPTSKRFAGNEPAVVKPQSGRLELSASTAAIVGEQIVYESLSGNIGSWQGWNDQVSWTVDQQAPAAFDVYLNYACDAASAGNRFVLEADGQSIAGTVKSTGGWNSYAITKAGSVMLSPGSQRLVLKPDAGELHGALLNLRSIYLVPAGDAFDPSSFQRQATPAEVTDAARRILDDTLQDAVRESVVARYPAYAAELIVAMTDDLPKDLTEEYRRIPWIWRVAVACGKRNQLDQMRAVLDASLPQIGEQLRDWQSVVIGGGIINGIGLKGGWPHGRLKELITKFPEMESRWKQLMSLAATMVDDQRILEGTRYDAMRIIALEEGVAPRQQLTKYLQRGTHDELQMGAISGLSDIDGPEVPDVLLDNLGHFNEENRVLALDALVRLDSRCDALLSAIADRRVPVALLTSSQRLALLESMNDAIQSRALVVLKY